MKLEDHVCTKEQSQKMYELGIRGESLYYHTNSKFGILPKASVDFKNGYVKNAFNVREMGRIIGKGTKASEAHWQWLIGCVNSGLSATVAYNPVALAGFIITQLEIGNIDVEAINKRLSE